MIIYIYVYVYVYIFGHINLYIYIKYHFIPTVMAIVSSCQLEPTGRANLLVLGGKVPVDSRGAAIHKTWVSSFQIAVAMTCYMNINICICIYTCSSVR